MGGTHQDAADRVVGMVASRERTAKEELQVLINLVERDLRQLRDLQSFLPEALSGGADKVLANIFRSLQENRST